MRNYTPGPWSYDPLDRVIIKEDVKDIAHMDRCATDADASLISAAPELLEKLDKLLRIVENNWLNQECEPDEWESYQEFRQVISKAKGETE